MNGIVTIREITPTEHGNMQQVNANSEHDSLQFEINTDLYELDVDDALMWNLYDGWFTSLPTVDCILNGNIINVEQEKLTISASGLLIHIECNDKDEFNEGWKVGREVCVSLSLLKYRN